MFKLMYFVLSFTSSVLMNSRREKNEKKNPVVKWERSWNAGSSGIVDSFSDGLFEIGIDDV